VNGRRGPFVNIFLFFFSPYPFRRELLPRSPRLRATAQQGRLPCQRLAPGMGQRSPASDSQQGCPAPPPPQPGRAPPQASTTRCPEPSLAAKLGPAPELTPRVGGLQLVRSVSLPELACALVRSQVVHPAARSELALTAAACAARMCGAMGEALPRGHARCVSSSSSPMLVAHLLFFVVSSSHPGRIPVQEIFRDGSPHIYTEYLELGRPRPS
jgi:hypothetical protein